LGLNNVINASYLGFGLHLLIGILLGIALGAIGIRWEKIRTFMLIPYKSSLFGVGAGIVFDTKLMYIVTNWMDSV
jgi:hypothetical protein